MVGKKEKCYKKYKDRLIKGQRRDEVKDVKREEEWMEVIKSGGVGPRHEVISGWESE